jgi:hypothetical protein
VCSSFNPIRDVACVTDDDDDDSESELPDDEEEPVASPPRRVVVSHGEDDGNGRGDDGKYADGADGWKKKACGRSQGATEGTQPDAEPSQSQRLALSSCRASEAMVLGVSDVV